ncbi:MAG TPA: hypothetical protein VFP65_18575, partial [Anaeromyxobacteraceae bacterium]|nr:hypothetical protein [Anaeromyxobacteraceae bacterium]
PPSDAHVVPQAAPAPDALAEAVAAVSAPAAAAAAAPAPKPMTAKEKQAAAKKAAAEKAAAEREAKRVAKLEAAEKARAAREARKAAAAEARRAEDAARALAAAEKPREVKELGFQQTASASRVFVRCSAPPRFTISDAGARAVRVELPNTRLVRRNDARPFDTSFFPGAVASVTPRRHGRTLVLEIALKEKVSWQQKVEGDVLAIDFERPVALKAQAQASH